MNKITINGIELELTDEQAAELVEQYKAKQGDWPRDDYVYWFVDDVGDVFDTIFADVCNNDTWRKSIGNCFRTLKEAEHYRDYLVALNTLKKSSDFVPDWGNNNQLKYFVYYNVRLSERLDTSSTRCNHYGVPIYYRTCKEAEAALSKYSREFEIVYGIAK